MPQIPYKKEKITTALLLAAGTGSRLKPFTNFSPKCLTEINGIPILERLVRTLERHDFQRLVVVTGHLSQSIKDFLDGLSMDMDVIYIHNSKYLTTNNIYSLWLARNLMQKSFLLVECDLIFDTNLLEEMLVPNRMAISKIKPWMKGTTVAINTAKQVTNFYVEHSPDVDTSIYKTVNIYSIDLSSWNQIIDRLEQQILSGQVNDYYETVFEKMVADGSLSFKSVLFNAERWCEVDTVKDLHLAERIFSSLLEPVYLGQNQSSPSRLFSNAKFPLADPRSSLKSNQPHKGVEGATRVPKNK